MKVKKHWAERFIDWYPHHTKLYIRGERNKNWEEMSKLREELFKQLVPFFEEMEKEIVKTKTPKITVDNQGRTMEDGWYVSGCPFCGSGFGCGCK